jgi:hypothetical protein
MVVLTISWLYPLTPSKQPERGRSAMKQLVLGRKWASHIRADLVVAHDQVVGRTEH